MTCEDIKLLISPFLDHELEDAENKQVTEHLSACLHCRKELALLQETWEILDENEQLKPSADYISQFWTKLAQEQTWQEKIISQFKQFAFRPRLLPAASMVFVLLIVGGFLVQTYTQQQSDPVELSVIDPLEMDIIENVESIDDYDVIADMDFYENFDLIEEIEVLELTKAQA